MLLMLGKREARIDHRIPRFSAVTSLPDPPPNANWYADVPLWGMLGNDDVGDCVIAAAMHQIMQLDAYRNPGDGLIPTTQEAVTAYSAVTGYVPGDANTDQGTYVLGQGGLIEYWSKTGLLCGGELNKPAAFCQITHKDPKQWQQAISTFGSLMIGMQLPQAIVAADDTPFVWDEYSGPVAGGHEVLLVGYETVAGTVVYDLVSWGTMYRAAEEFLLNVVDETVCVYDRVSLDARGVDPAGIDDQTLLAYMTRLQTET